MLFAILVFSDTFSGSNVRKLTHDELSRQRLDISTAKEAPRAPILGLLENIRSLYNVGSIFRTSDGAFIQKLYLCGYTPRPPRKEIEKTALGSTNTIPWEYFKSPADAIAAARTKGAKICVLEHTTGSIPTYRLDKSIFPVCLVVGNELTGVSPEVIALSDLAIEIPMYGTKQSLNAAVAYGIALFDLLRVWKTG